MKNALDHIGFKLPNHQVRELLNDMKKQGKLDEAKGVSKELFKEVYRIIYQKVRKFI
jgi:hypothetical protein